MSITIRLSCGYSFAGLGAATLVAVYPWPTREIKMEEIIMK
jgi:hypothetical protein